MQQLVLVVQDQDRPGVAVGDRSDGHGRRPGTARRVAGEQQDLRVARDGGRQVVPAGLDDGVEPAGPVTLEVEVVVRERGALGRHDRRLPARGRVGVVVLDEHERTGALVAPQHPDGGPERGQGRDVVGVRWGTRRIGQTGRGPLHAVVRGVAHPRHLVVHPGRPEHAPGVAVEGQRLAAGVVDGRRRADGGVPAGRGVVAVAVEPRRGPAGVGRAFRPGEDVRRDVQAVAGDDDIGAGFQAVVSGGDGLRPGVAGEAKKVVARARARAGHDGPPRPPGVPELALGLLARRRPGTGVAERLVPEADVARRSVRTGQRREQPGREQPPHHKQSRRQAMHDPTLRPQRGGPTRSHSPTVAFGPARWPRMRRTHHRA